MLRNINPLATCKIVKCIYTVGMGNNDYINNYFSQFYPKRSIYTPEQFATVLIQQYSHQLKNREYYTFWDAVHPTEASNVISAGRSYNALLPSDTYPFDIRRLAETVISMENNLSIYQQQKREF
ncbi:hypothetical protein ACOSP7_004037 [Xanthoceras sorbifolium]